MAHITGGGWTNIGRINKTVGYEIDRPLPVLPIFDQLLKHVESRTEMYHTFNMGMGLAVVCDKSDADTILKTFNEGGFAAAQIGQVKDSYKGIRVSTEEEMLEIAFSNKT